MKTGTSLYLDLVRFSAAMMVFLEHLREHTKVGFRTFWSAHPFWRDHLYFYSQTAVIVFFVLSGYVIAHVMVTRERTPLEYAASRFARLYSVVLPALLLTVASNYAEALRFPTAFHTFESQGGVGVVLSYLGTAFFVSQFWLWPDLEPPNAPFWSLSVEATYYVAIGLFVFAKGRTRLLSLVFLGLAAGPTIVLLAPLWLLGYGAYHLSQHWRPQASAAMILWIGSGLLLCLTPLIEEHVRLQLSFLRMPDRSLGELLGAYAAALCFATNAIAFNAISDRGESFLRRFTRLIRWLGSMTFELYLFHQPLLSLFKVYNVGNPSSRAQMLLLFGGTFLVVATLGRLCEQSKVAYKRWFLSIGSRIATRAAAIP
jgi:peptidoglycan/LPS O-acetylase OafA/YrhL